jgi:hypothetical protein
VLAGLGFILMLVGQGDRSREVCEEALDVARSVGARAAEVRALASLGNVLENMGDRRGGIASLRRARALARDVGQPEVLAQTAIGLSDALRKAGSWTRRSPSAWRAPRRPTAPAWAPLRGPSAP